MTDSIESKAGTCVFVCTTPQNSKVTQTECEAFTYIEIESAGDVSNRGVQGNNVQYSTLKEPVDQQAKGTGKIPDLVIDCAYAKNSAPGQEFMISAAAVSDKNNYVYKIERDDADPSRTNTIEYHRGYVSSYEINGGGSNDPERISFTAACNQEPILVKSTAI